jgi:hypothetical protein
VPTRPDLIPSQGRRGTGRDPGAPLATRDQAGVPGRVFRAALLIVMGRRRGRKPRQPGRSALLPAGPGILCPITPDDALVLQ